MSHDHSQHGPHGYADAPPQAGGAPRTLILKRLRRIEGQVRGISRMVDDDTYCIDILTQVSAVNRALEAVALKLLDDHLAHCVADAISGGGADADIKLKEANDAIARLVRS